MAGPGVELALGVVDDAQFGPLVMVAAGGVLVEVLRDRRFALPPVGHHQAMAMLDRLAVRPLLDGVRGARLLRAHPDAVSFAGTLLCHTAAVRDALRERLIAARVYPPVLWPLEPAAVKGYLEHYQFRFPVAIDPDWKTLEQWWLDRERGFTSVSFLLDKKGVIRFIHPGGKYAPGSPDLAEIEKKIEALLSE